jgi:hypothetical protein
MDSSLQLLGLYRQFALSLIAMVCWNERNRVIFSQLGTLYFNVFILKVVNFFNVWIDTNSSLKQLCRVDYVMTITED